MVDDDGVRMPAAPPSPVAASPVAASPVAASPVAPASPNPPPGAERVKRPIIERLGLALVALVLASLFGAVAAAAWVGGELFLAAMGAIGCLLTVWVAGLTLFRG